MIHYFYSLTISTIHYISSTIKVKVNVGIAAN